MNETVNETPNETVPPGSAWLRFVAVLVLAFLGMVLGRECWTSFREIEDLRNEGVVTPADVHEVREMAHKHSVDYDLLYTFTVPGRDERFGHRDSNLRWRTFLWCSVPREVWLKASQDRKVDVVYLPGNPLVNRAVAGETGWNGVVILGLASAGMLLAGASMLARMVAGGPTHHGEMIAQYNYHPGRTFAGLAVTAAICASAIHPLLLAALADDGPKIFYHLQFDGGSATAIRWGLVGAAALMLVGCLFGMGSILVRRPERLALTTNGILLARGGWAQPSDFVPYHEISHLALDIDRGLEFDHPLGHVTIGRAGLSQANFEEMFEIVQSRLGDRVHLRPLETRP